MVTQVYVPKHEVNIDILVLNHQINDFGYLFKCINFKTCYDSLVLEHIMNRTENTYNNSKYHREFFTLRDFYFEPLQKDSKNKNISVVKNFYKHINKNGIVGQIYTRLVTVYIGFITCLNGLKLFVKNKNFRADIWSHKTDVLKLLKGQNKEIHSK